MLRAILNKYWQQRPTRHQLYGHLPRITKTIQIRRTRHAGHCWRSRDELISDVLLWIPTHGRAKAGRPARTYIQQLCEDTGCCPEDLPRAMNDKEEWRERVRDIRATSAIWWWWYIYIYICMLAGIYLYRYMYIYTSKWSRWPWSRMAWRLHFQLLPHRCVGKGTIPFPGLLQFTLDPYLITLSVMQGGIKYLFFQSLVWLDLGLNPGFPDDWWTLYSLVQWPGV